LCAGFDVVEFEMVAGTITDDENAGVVWEPTDWLSPRGAKYLIIRISVNPTAAKETTTTQ
jgi:hypothetical protein